MSHEGSCMNGQNPSWDKGSTWGTAIIVASPVIWESFQLKNLLKWLCLEGFNKLIKFLLSNLITTSTQLLHLVFVLPKIQNKIINWILLNNVQVWIFSVLACKHAHDSIAYIRELWSQALEVNGSLIYLYSSHNFLTFKNYCDGISLFSFVYTVCW